MEKKELTVKGIFNSNDVKKRFEELLGKKSQGFITSVLQCVNSNGKLQKADPVTVYTAAATAAALDLPINNNLGYAYIVPYKTKQADGTWKDVAQFQIGYLGYKKLAYNTGIIKKMNVTDVKEGEISHFNRLDGEIVFDFIQDVKERLKKKTIGYVSYFKTQNGLESTKFMTVEEIKEHGKKYSKTFNVGLWKNNFEVMARKTVVKQHLSKEPILSIENLNILGEAYKSDQSVQEKEGDYQYPDNPVNLTLEESNELEEARRINSFIEKADTVEKLEKLIDIANGEQLEIILNKIENLKQQAENGKEKETTR